MPAAMDRKRKLDLGNTSASKGASASSSSEGVNPWTGRPYSKKYQEILAGRLKLPVYKFKEQLLEAEQPGHNSAHGRSGAGYAGGGRSWDRETMRT